MKCSHAEVELISSGSSIKICLVAEGKADVYPRFAPTMEWDTAAGHAIARAAGMEIYRRGRKNLCNIIRRIAESVVYRRTQAY